MKLVKVVWWDTNETSDSGWCTKEEAESASPCRVASYGVVVKETDKFLTIAADLYATVVDENFDETKEVDDLFGRVQCLPK